MIPDANNRLPNAVISLLIWLFPASTIKNALLRRIGNTVAKSARIHPCLVWKCGAFEVADRAHIGAFNIFRTVRRLTLAEGAEIGNFNWISAGPEHQLHPNAGTLILEKNAAITGKHYIDCSGIVRLEPYATIGGHGSVIQSHSPDLEAGVVSAGKVTLGDHSLVSTRCVVLQDAFLPARSVLAAGGVLIARRPNDIAAPGGLYAGVPAKRVKEMPESGFFVRVESQMRVGPMDSLD